MGTPSLTTLTSDRVFPGDLTPLLSKTSRHEAGHPAGSRGTGLIPGPGPARRPNARRRDEFARRVPLRMIEATGAEIARHGCRDHPGHGFARQNPLDAGCPAIGRRLSGYWAPVVWLLGAGCLAIGRRLSGYWAPVVWLLGAGCLAIGRRLSGLTNPATDALYAASGESTRWTPRPRGRTSPWRIAGVRKSW